MHALGFLPTARELSSRIVTVVSSSSSTTLYAILSSLPCYHSNQQVHNKKNMYTDYL